ncbi:MAG: aminotransferase class I/II-fold pyridoxal phosphate-dependent enzyme, partial [Rhodospirillaceae bacterium]|nr:aminotransferase class I/II-fold pyridoxal phosphate-dependent enzyme [Rhodospirillaceae bacterium]
AMTGWRLGWSIWPKALVEPATRLAINDHSCVNASAQWAGVEALNGPQDAVDAMVRAFDERRIAIHKELNALPGVSCQLPTGAFYAFPNITGTGLDAKTLQDRMLAEIGVATVAGTSFGQFGEGYLRFSYANSLENIQAAMGRIRGFLEAEMK